MVDQQKIQRWSTLYAIPQNTIEQLLGKDENAIIVRQDLNLAYKILHKNSQWLAQFLADMPSPTRRAGEFAVDIDFLFPTAEGWYQLFRADIGHPADYFEKESELAAWFWDEEGKEFYTGETINVPGRGMGPNLPTYLQTTGFWPEGVRQLLRHLNYLVEREYLIYSCAIGYKVDNRRGVDFGFHSMGTNPAILSYVVRGYLFDVTSSLQVDEDESDLLQFWSKADSHKILKQINVVNEKFIQIPRRGEEKSAEELLQEFRAVVKFARAGRSK